MMNNFKRCLVAGAVAFVLAGCSGSDGKDGTNGTDGENGQDGTSPVPYTTTIEQAYDFKLDLTPADISMSDGKPLSVTFKATNNFGVPLSGIHKATLIASSEDENGEWINHVWTNEPGGYLYCTPEGTMEDDGETVNTCTLTETEVGTYEATWDHEGQAPVILKGADVNAVNRLIVRLYKMKNAEGEYISDKVFAAPITFIPSTGELATPTKTTISTESCIACHGSIEGFEDGDKRIAKLEAHHNYQTVEACVSCHNPSLENHPLFDTDVGWNINFDEMIHRLHAGHQAEAKFGMPLQGMAHDFFGDIGFPNELNDCSSCHDNNAWKEIVNEGACVSCHLTVNLTTGENHAGIVPNGDEACLGCHTSGSLGAEGAHSVGLRAEGTDLVSLDVTSVKFDGVELAVKVVVNLNGEPLMTETLAEVLKSIPEEHHMPIGVVTGKGIIHRIIPEYHHNVRVFDQEFDATDSSFTMTITEDMVMEDFKAEFANLGNKTVWVSSDIAVCVAKDTVGNAVLAECKDAGHSGLDYAVAAKMTPKYWNMATDNGDNPILPRFADESRMNVSEAKCNACHGSLTIPKLAHVHGVDDFGSCSACHNETNTGTYHGRVTKFAPGEDTPETTKYEVYSRDLSTVTHRYHSGHWDSQDPSGVYLTSEDELKGYSASKTDCSVCHKEESPLFGTDGGLFSGKIATQVTDTWIAPHLVGQKLEDDVPAVGYISPVAEACRSCHAHSDKAAIAHFKTNGAYVAEFDSEGNLLPESISGTKEMSVESCGVCHAKGKSFGVDKFHKF
ncbi:OmcA/MtrC family decaheme c-type cytochrome [Shewanella sp. KX20019]|uniref:OmcA/MtrC family decaheme c-type cytochrome n=1 Tax=Shewanella sp. KX20019 TaxID=2803864 RepID=UPI001928AA5E|nr:OmcA/MtrC family decaheme c-type cytochrome [Shewanella sp. KX20019]QQX81671.1 OmcA/MtrC family decaheme c-type cytochrome [Shewanella sp. KX20019]